MKRNILSNYKNTKRYMLLSDAMRVLLELVVANINSSSKRCANKQRKNYVTYSELCKRLDRIVSPEEISNSIDILFDLQEISIQDLQRDDLFVRAYAPATEIVQESMTDLFILTPLARINP